MPKCTLEIQDEVNVRFVGLAESVIQECVDKLTFHVPNYVFMEAYKMGRWKGTVTLFKPTGATFLHLLPDVLPIIERERYQISVVDHRHAWNISIPKIDKDLFAGKSYGQFQGVLADHQVTAINTVTGRNVGCIELATGSGKTVVTAGLVKLYQQYGKILVIVPRIDLAIETQLTIQYLGLEAGIFFGEAKDPKHTTVTTWQSLEETPELFAGVTAVICDEAHEAKAKVLNELLTKTGKNVPIRVGMTGTMPEVELYEAQIRAALGPVIFSLPAYELQQSGFLASCFIRIMKFMDSKNSEYKKALKDGRFDDFLDIMNWQFESRIRTDYLATLIGEIALTGNTLILVRYKKHGRELVKRIPGSIFLTGEDAGTKRHATYKEINQEDNVPLICTYGIASTGINVPRLYNLVMIEPGKQPVKLIQAIGRVLRRAVDKDHSNVWHIASDMIMAKNHITAAKHIYRDAKYPFSEEEVDYIEDSQ